ncbi:RNA polymerase sigma factor [Streptomyces sp. NPDC002250]|uniref:RNA polymerase sigma factor n=1 Tax=Streptomyces sp. NPDC002250 TaxID=3364641 RepID=UPI0036C3A3E3
MDERLPGDEAESGDHSELTTPVLRRLGFEVDDIEACLVPQPRSASLPNHHEQLVADARLVQALRERDFAGPLYERFADELRRYGWPVMMSWNVSGEIFHQCRLIGRPVGAKLIVPSWDRQDCIDVANETVAAGLALFRSKALVERRWQQHLGASLRTYFVGACLRAFPPIYAAWSRVRRDELRHTATEEEELTRRIDLATPYTHDPCDAAVLQQEIRRVMSEIDDPNLRAGVVWLAAGYSQSETAAMIGLTRKSLERRLSRLRAKLKQDGGNKGGAR